MQIPEKGSPDLNLTSRISPTLALSGFNLANSRVRDEVGSRMASCCSTNVTRGSLQILRVEGGGGYVFIRRGAEWKRENRVHSKYNHVELIATYCGVSQYLGCRWELAMVEVVEVVGMSKGRVDESGCALDGVYGGIPSSYSMAASRTLWKTFVICKTSLKGHL